VLALYAGEGGVRLALEPLHPMYCADRAVLSTLAQALELAERHPVEQVGVVVDTFHVWWDPDVMAQIARAGERIASFQLADFLTPLPADVLLGRGLPGDGHVDFPPLGRLHSPSSRTAFSFSTSGRTSSLIGSCSKSASQRSGVMSGKSDPNSILCLSMLFV
jgi:hypothetical protein